MEDVLERARVGDAEAFRALVEPHRAELRLHCYRLLGSFHDAEDALQDTLLSAWQGLPGFEGRSSVRTWLYRIATHRCLNVRRAAARRPVDLTGSDEVPWLEPYPDALLGVLPDVGPEARYEQREALSLAFVTAAQLLPPRQVAVLVLRDVLGFPATEVAVLLGTTVDAVHSALKRARSSLSVRLPEQRPPAAPAGAVVAEFVRAYTAGDVPALLAVLTDDVRVSMPPEPQVHRGLDDVAAFYRRVVRPDRTYELVPTSANGSPAFGTYLRSPGRAGTGLLVLALRGDRVRAVTRFGASVLPSFGLPASLG